MMWKFFVLPVSLFRIAAMASLDLEEHRRTDTVTLPHSFMIAAEGSTAMPGRSPANAGTGTHGTGTL